jgi:hypothetical protein
LFARGGPRFFLDSTARLSLEVDATGNIAFNQEQIWVARTDFNELNASYDAKVVGDYTGLTAP